MNRMLLLLGRITRTMSHWKHLTSDVKPHLRAFYEVSCASVITKAGTILIGLYILFIVDGIISIHPWISEGGENIFNLFWIVFAFSLLHYSLGWITEGGGVVATIALSTTEDYLMTCYVDEGSMVAGFFALTDLSLVKFWQFSELAGCIAYLLTLFGSMLLLFVSNTSACSQRLESSQEWYQMERSNGKSVQDFSEWITLGFQTHAKKFGILFIFLVVFSHLTGFSEMLVLPILVYLFAAIQYMYLATIYKNEEVIFETTVFGQILIQLKNHIQPVLFVIWMGFLQQVASIRK